MSTSVASSILSFAEARQVVESHASKLRPGSPELLPLLDAVGLVLAEDLRADRDFPPFPRSTRDGFAVRTKDLATVPVSLRCVGEIRAGASVEQSTISLQDGETVEIMTGAPVPADADAVVMVEYTRRSDSTIIIDRAVQTGENIVPAGAEARKDQVVVPRGTRVNHATVAIAAAVGLPEIAVYRRQRVAILATGDEVVDINLPPAQNEIRNSNSYSLAAQVYAAGGEPVVLPIAHDDLQDLSAMLRHGLTADLLLLTGGVSMGKYDLVEQALASFNARFFFTGVWIQPGKPVVFGEVGTGDRVVPFFGLPGNPVSTMVTFQLFVQPVIDGLSGSPARPLRFAQARLRSEFSTKTGLTRFLPGKLTGTLEQPEAEMVHWHGSGDLMAVSQANCYIVVPPDRKHFEAGETITVLLF